MNYIPVMLSWKFMNLSSVTCRSTHECHPSCSKHEHSCYPRRVFMNIHVIREVYSWIFMSSVTCTHEFSCHPSRVLMNIHVIRHVYSWIFMSSVTCTHEYSCHLWCTHDFSCHLWCVLMNIHDTPDVCSWICHTWRVLMNIHVTNECYSWIFILPLMNIHVTSDVTHWYSCYQGRVLINIQTIMPCNNEYSNCPWRTHSEYSLTYRHAIWISILPSRFQVKSTYHFDNR